jgi:hypothetical protein
VSAPAPAADHPVTYAARLLTAIQHEHGALGASRLGDCHRALVRTALRALNCANEGLSLHRPEVAGESHYCRHCLSRSTTYPCRDAARYITARDAALSDLQTLGQAYHLTQAHLLSDKAQP